MQSTVLVTGLILFAGFTWAVKYHFVSSAAPIRFWLLTVPPAANMAVFARELWRRQKSLEMLSLALVLFAVSAALFLWAVQASRATHRLKLIFEQDNPRFVLRSGPYAYIRHPFYASYNLFWLSCGLATLHTINLAYFLVLFPVYVVSALQEERGFKQSSRAAEYEQYRKTAGLFWPKF